MYLIFALNMASLPLLYHFWAEQLHKSHFQIVETLLSSENLEHFNRFSLNNEGKPQFDAFKTQKSKSSEKIY